MIDGDLYKLSSSWLLTEQLNLKREFYLVYRLKYSQGCLIILPLLSDAKENESMEALVLPQQ